MMMYAGSTAADAGNTGREAGKADLADDRQGIHHRHERRVRLDFH